MQWLEISSGSHGCAGEIEDAMSGWVVVYEWGTLYSGSTSYREAHASVTQTRQGRCLSCQPDVAKSMRKGAWVRLLRIPLIIRGKTRI